MKNPEDDPMIAEIREYREKQAARFGYDAAAIIRDARTRLDVSGRPSVQYPPRRLEEPPAPERRGRPRPDASKPSGRE